MREIGKSLIALKSRYIGFRSGQSKNIAPVLQWARLAFASTGISAAFLVNACFLQQALFRFRIEQMDQIGLHREADVLMA